MTNFSFICLPFDDWNWWCLHSYKVSKSTNSDCGAKLQRKNLNLWTHPVKILGLSYHCRPLYLLSWWQRIWMCISDWSSQNIFILTVYLSDLLMLSSKNPWLLILLLLLQLLCNFLYHALMNGNYFLILFIFYL